MSSSTKAACVAVLLGAFASAALAQAPLAEPRTQGGVRYLSGGAGDDEAQAVKAAMHDYSLALLFSQNGGEYLANVAVAIDDARGTTVLKVPAAGPYLLVGLPPGKYSVVATYRGEAKTQTVSVQGVAKTPVSFVWK